MRIWKKSSKQSWKKLHVTLSSTGWSASLVLAADLSTSPSISWLSPSMDERIGGLMGFTGIFIGLAFVLRLNWLSVKATKILDVRRSEFRGGGEFFFGEDPLTYGCLWSNTGQKYRVISRKCWRWTTRHYQSKRRCPLSTAGAFFICTL